MPKRNGGRPDESANVDYWRASTESVLSRLAILRARDVSARELVLACRAVVALVRRLTAPWPASLASRCAAITDPEIARIAPWADGPIVAPARPSDEALERIGMSLEQWRASLPQVPSPFVRPLYERFYETMSDSAPLLAFARLLTAPTPEPLPPAPTTSIEARLQYRRASAALKRHAIAIQRGEYRHREDAVVRMEAAALKFRAHWFDLFAGNVSRLCGDRREALAFLQTLRREALENLESLYEPRRARARQRKARTIRRRRRPR